MEEKTDSELLREFARSTNRFIIEKDTPYPKSGVGIPQKFRRIIIIPNNAEKTSFFIWFSDPYARIGITTVFCGAFTRIPSKIKAKINIRKKTVIDKIDVFSRSKTNKIGNYLFDTKVVIKGIPGVAEKRFLSHTRVQQQIIDALEIEGILNVSLNEFNIDFMPELEGAAYLSIINPQSWILERDFIEQTFKQIEKLRLIVN